MTEKMKMLAALITAAGEIRANPDLGCFRNSGGRWYEVLWVDADGGLAYVGTFPLALTLNYFGSSSSVIVVPEGAFSRARESLGLAHEPPEHAGERPALTQVSAREKIGRELAAELRAIVTRPDFCAQEIENIARRVESL